MNTAPIDMPSANRIHLAMECLQEAESHGLLKDIDDSILSGYSGTRIIAALQRLAASFAGDDDACYLEVGVFQGLTLLSVAAAVPSMPCYGIDNFAFFDPERRNLSIVQSRRAAMGAHNAQVINEDFEGALAGLAGAVSGKSVAVYFVDGPHDYRSQLMCLELALPHLHRQAVVVVDDSNYAHVRQANRDFLVTHPEFKLLFEAYTRCHPANMDAVDHGVARRGWWNGVNVLVRDEHDVLEVMMPPTDRDRSLFENDHITHATEMSDLLADAGGLLSAMHHVAPLRFLREFIRLKMLMRRAGHRPAGRYPSMNTGSDGLPAGRLNRRRV